MPIGYKVVTERMDGLFSYLTAERAWSILITKYEVGKETKPINRRCPLMVFKTKWAADRFFSHYEFKGNLKIFKVKYKPSKKKQVFLIELIEYALEKAITKPSYHISRHLQSMSLTSFPEMTALASSVTLMEEVERD